MSRAICAIVISAAIAGCASQPEQQWVWYKQGATQADFETDHGYCTAQAFGNGNVSVMQVAIVQNACLKGRGWRQVPAQ
jgi:hypothetical protein